MKYMNPPPPDIITNTLIVDTISKTDNLKVSLEGTAKDSHLINLYITGNRYGITSENPHKMDLQPLLHFLDNVDLES